MRNNACSSCVVLACIVGACHTSHRSRVRPDAPVDVRAPGIATVVTGNGTIRIEVPGATGLERRVVLEERLPVPGMPRVYRVAEISPGLDDDAGVEWVFDWLDAGSDLETGQGRLLPHPDRAVLAELERALGATPPDPEAVVASLPRLVRLDSRSGILARAAALTPLPRASLEAVIEAATDARGGLRALTTRGRKPGGNLEEALEVVLPVLERRGDLDARETARIAGERARVREAAAR
jgi:hypothetical protein